MASKPTILVICGGGNGAHSFAGVASSAPNTNVRVLTLFQDEADRWTKSMQEHGFRVELTRRGKQPVDLTSKPDLITKDPKQAITGCDVITFNMPAFAHAQYLHAIKPYIEPGMTIAGLPGQCGFDLQARSILGPELANQCTIMNFESLPWACRIKRFGAMCEVLGTKESLLGALHTGNVPPKVDPTSTLQRLMGDLPILTVRGHLLGVTLMSINAYVHTGILYSHWVDWDGQPLDEKPLFYQGLNQTAADLLSTLSKEVLTIADAITDRDPSVDMSEVIHVYDWYMRCYPQDINDKSSLKSAIITNAAYRGLQHPMESTARGLVPSYEFRYTTEDVPYGLLVIRGIAELLGVTTPNMDKVITWAQEKIGKRFLVDGRVKGEDIGETRAPQRYGITAFDGLLWN